MTRIKGNFNFPANFEVLAKAPLDAKQKVDTHADLVIYGYIMEQLLVLETIQIH
jgi:hypothetical protein